MIPKPSLIPLMLVSAICPVSASTLLIDFGTPAATPTLGGTWNSTQALGTNVALVDSNNLATTVTLNIDAATSTSAEAGNTWTGGNKLWVDAAATSDYIWKGASSTQSATITVTLSGLDNSLTYDLSLVAVRATAGSSNRIGSYLVQGLSTADEVSSTSYNTFTQWGNRGILNWSAVTPVGGSIVITATAAPNQTVFLNAMKVTAVPEPASIAITGLSFAPLALLRKRRHG